MRILMGLLCVGFLAACSDARPPQARPKRPLQPPSSTAKSSVDANLFPQDGGYRYDPENKTDPFRSFIRAAREGQEHSIASPLERFDLSQLRVTGIVWGRKQPRALVEDPAGKGYVVAVGMAIGKNHGRIIRIGDNQLVVKETYVDFRDQATTKEVEMHLYETQGG